MHVHSGRELHTVQLVWHQTSASQHTAHEQLARMHATHVKPPQGVIGSAGMSKS